MEWGGEVVGVRSVCVCFSLVYSRFGLILVLSWPLLQGISDPVGIVERYFRENPYGSCSRCETLFTLVCPSFLVEHSISLYKVIKPTLALPLRPPTRCNSVPA